jgi:hypothetical protein
MNWNIKYASERRSHLEEYTHPIPEPANFVNHVWEHHPSFREYCADLAERNLGTTAESQKEYIHKEIIIDPDFYKKFSSIHLDIEHGEDGENGVAGDHPHKHIDDKQIIVDVPNALKELNNV